MRILCLGINDIRSPVDGLPEYERYFSLFMGNQNEVTFINVVPKQLEQPITDETFEIVPGVQVRQILVSVADFWDPSESDVWKYPNMIKAMFMLAGWRPDVIIMHDWAFSPALYSLPSDVPVIYMCHLFHVAKNMTVGMTIPQAETSEQKGMEDIAELIIANSESTASDIANVFPHLKPKTIPVPLGVDKQRYRPMPAPDSRIILYMGRLDPMKNVSDFLDDVERNQQMLKDMGFQVWIAGKGAELQRVVDMHYAGKINYLYMVTGEKKMQVLSQAKYMVFPSLYEPWGLALNEGLATGKICLATPVGGHTEQINDKKNGVFVQDGQWVNAIMQIEQNKRQQEKIMKKAPESARDIREHFQALIGEINGFIGAG